MNEQEAQDATRLSPAQEARTREILGDGRFRAVIDTMFDRFFGRSGDASPGRAAAEALGWIDPATGGFTRLGYFAADPDSAAAGKPVFNRTVTLKDSYAKAK